MKKSSPGMSIRNCLCLVAIAIFLWLPVIAAEAKPVQATKSISGTVIAASDGFPLIGASVIVKGTTNGNITDFDGNYVLNEVSEDAVLTFSYIGYRSKDISVAGQSVINVTLEEDSEQLDEVVVIGYGVQKKKLNTGATVQVKGDDIAKLNTTNPLQAMQGQSPGVSISSTSGQPGADMKVTIRGLGTVGNASPLYIIDGIEGDISVLNASDIQSIDVLKDAASAAIYGAQAANGVILVTTKSGSKGKAQVSFDGYYGIQNRPRKLRMLNREEYKVIMNEQAVNSGSAPYDFTQYGDLADTDWLDQMFVSNAKTENYSLGVNGGSENSVYSLSLSYTGQEGIVGGKDVSNYERYGFRINTEHKLYGDVLKVGQHLNFNYVKNNGIYVGDQYSNNLRSAFNASPFAPVYSDNNKFDSPYNDTSESLWNNGDGNPYGTMMTANQNQNNNQKLLADVYAELEPIKNLKIRTVFGINYSTNEYRSYTPMYKFSIYDTANEDHSTVSHNMSRNLSLTWTNTASYDFVVNEDHSFNALIGIEAYRYQGSYLSGSNWNLLSQFDDFNHAYLDNTTGQAYLNDDGTITHTVSVSSKPENIARRLSYFARIGYNYQEKYMLNATLRADGSSKFAKGNRWGYFPSVSAGWVITNEDFMNDIASGTVMDFLKLRLSWGQVGNQNISDYQYAAPVNTSTGYDANNPAAYYVFGNSGTNVLGAYPSRLSNENIKWETSEQTNIGVDARFLSSRLSANADFYIKTTKDWLVQAPVLATAGAGAPYINGGDVKNTGFELALNWNDRIGKVNYSVGVNGAYNKNKVGNIPTEDGIIHGETNTLYNNSEEFYRAENGHAIGYFWGFKTDGIFQNEQEIADWQAAGKGILQTDVKPGDVRYVDVNGDGVIDEYDKVDLGSGNPKFTYGFNISLDYKGFDFSIVANGVAGNKIVQSYREQSTLYSNYSTSILDRWTGEGTSNKIPRVTESNINWQFSDLYIQKGDFLRISNITLGYDFKKMIKWQYISQCRVYASVQNAFTFTKYTGMDPEIGYGIEDWVSGVDLGYYPRPRTFLFGVNLKF
ncbi:MAG: TonB-dependent receptor [Tannerellaceae bacterium]|nr:TonB-dependent receptor [Tannerellaceae bacterium]